MSDYFLIVFDQQRAILGLLFAAFIVCFPNGHRQGKFVLRTVLGVAICFIHGMLWIPLYDSMQVNYYFYMPLGFLYILFESFLVYLIIMMCFDISPAEAMFRCIVAKTMDMTVTVFLRNIIVYTFFPELPEKYFRLYILVMIAVYYIVYGILYRWTINDINGGNPEEYFSGNKGLFYSLALSYLGVCFLMALIQTICEHVISPLADHTELGGIYYEVYVFGILSLLLIAALIDIALVRIYREAVLESERNLFSQLLKEKAKQYEFVKENADVINRKCHELKKQLHALEEDGNTEKNTTLREISKALNFYDTTVKTGNEVLDTILTEKSILCANRGIKLSCMVNSANINHIGTMDLYTILDIALDSAIRYESSIPDPEKKIISFMLTSAGSMNYIVIENYYDQEHSPYQITDKREYRKAFGTVRQIARHYHGEIMTSKENNVYQFQIILPDNT